MSSGEKKVRQHLNDALSEKYQTQVGQKVLVERHKLHDNERRSALKEVLTDIAGDLQTIGDVPRGAEHIGSFSVHAYYAPTLEQMFFATVNAPGKCTFNVAESASAELFGTICEQYGVRRQKKRSGL